ncbi:MAG: polyphosphate kinase 2 [Flavobacteriales bacterium]|nr:MAG: polyphosphate kinase 2 [Flavobacteriales bacterium]
MLTTENFKSLENGDITKKQFLELIKSTSSSTKLEKILYNLEYEDQLYKLQSELVNLQEWVSKNKKRVCIIFEGRDAAGKGGAIRRMTQHLNPRSRRVVALAKPTEIEQGQWYFRRYIKEMPNPGELVFFDRSWYNRAVVEPVMGFCTQEQYKKFMIQVPEFEQMLHEDGIILIKFWFSVTKDEQLRRFKSRIASPLKKWKFSSVDEEGQNKWDLYTQYKDQMFAHTHTTSSPWIIIKTNNKKEARLESLRHVLSRFDYDFKGNSGTTLLPDPNIVKPYH